MKKTILAGVAALGALSAAAQAVEQPKFFDNWSIGLDGGVTTPMNHHPFFGSMRGLAGLHVDKQITPVFGMGVEGQFGVNTSSWHGFTRSTTAFDNSYVGVYGTVDLFNLFGGYQCDLRPFTIDAVAGAGWGHLYLNEEAGPDVNYFGTKVGLNFNFNVSKVVTLALKPSINWNMNGGGAKQSATDYNIYRATFNLMAGVTFHFGGGFDCVRPYNQAEIDALNGQINALRGDLELTAAENAAIATRAAALQNELNACRSRKPEVVKEVSNQLNSVRFVFFRVGSSKITADQMPNVEMIADYMKNHPASKVVIKGYASPEGNLDFNIRLAQNRAESVRNTLIKRFKIAGDRITAQGEGIGNMFEEDSWNRVSICTLEETGK